MSAYSELYYNPPTLWESCQPVGGLNASDQRSGGRQISVKRHERLSAARSLKRTVNVRQQIGVTSGYVRNAHSEVKRESKNARRKRQRYGK